MRAKLIPMGLTPDYIPNMGAWEAARELAANCMDADPQYKRHVTIDENPDFIQFSTRTVPKLAEMIFMGCGQSRKDEDKIGQFGEGFKIAALIATRARGGSLTLETRTHTLYFIFKELFGERVLHARVVESPNANRWNPETAFKATLTMKGARNITEGRLINGDTTRCWKKENEREDVKIFCKGIFITFIKSVQSNYHYNLNSLTLNRDRSMATGYTLHYAVAGLVYYHMNDDMAEYLITHPECWENMCLKEYGTPYNDSGKKKLAAAFRRRYGDDAILASPNAADNEVATLRGFKVVHVAPSIADLIHSLPKENVPADAMAARVGNATDAIPKDEGYVSIPTPEKYVREMAELRRIVDVLNVPCEIQIFPANARKIAGLCLIRSDGAMCTMWLNESLFAPGQRLERLRTLCHEIAHMDTGATDATISFELSLDKMAGLLASKLLDLLPS